MNILITGGAGFIGSHIAEFFQGKARIRVLDNLRTGYKKNLNGLQVEFLEGSITDRDIVNYAMNGTDIVFHLAALVSVPESMANPQECANINVSGHLNILESAARAGVKKLVFASSAAIYGNNPEVPKREEMTPEPQSPYAITKLDGEFYNALFTRTGKLQTASTRFFNVFGARQDPKGAYAAAVPIFIEKALANEPITIYGDGEQTRDFIYVKDVVGALAFTAMTPLNGTFNVGYGQRISINSLAQKIIMLTNSKSEIRHLPERAGDVKHSLASAEKLQSAGWKPEFSFEAGLAQTIEKNPKLDTSGVIL